MWTWIQKEWAFLKKWLGIKPVFEVTVFYKSGNKATGLFEKFIVKNNAVSWAYHGEKNLHPLNLGVDNIEAVWYKVK